MTHKYLALAQESRVRRCLGDGAVLNDGSRTHCSDVSEEKMSWWKESGDVTWEGRVDVRS